MEEPALAQILHLFIRRSLPWQGQECPNWHSGIRHVSNGCKRVEKRFREFRARKAGAVLSGRHKGQDAGAGNAPAPWFVGSNGDGA